MKTITIEQIRSWKPSYDPSRYAPDGWSGTARDVLMLERVPPQDRLWVVLRGECLDDRTLRLFAAWCAEQALELVGESERDPRSVAAVAAARAFAEGKITERELAAARDAAMSAAWYCDMAASDAASEVAVWSCARAISRSAAEAAVLSSASSFARAAQVAQLLTMI
jgi:hypothetical protein